MLFLGTTYLMMDAMAPLTVLSQFFQTENIGVALLKIGSLHYEIFKIKTACIK